MHNTILDWLEDLGRTPQNAEALLSYRKDVIAKRDWAIPIWFAGSLTISGAIFLPTYFLFNPGYGSWAAPIMLLCLALTGWSGVYAYLYRRYLLFGDQPQETRIAIESVLKYRTTRGLTRKFGPESVVVLNEGARRLLQCRELLANPVWKAKALSESRKQAVEGAKAAAEASMLRIIRLVVAQGDLKEAHQVITQLDDLATLLARLTARQEEFATTAGGEQTSLRAALMTLREIDTAETEVQRETLR